MPRVSSGLPQLLTEHVGSSRERGVRITHALRDPGGAVPGNVRVHARTALGAGRLELDHGRQRLVVDLDQPRGVLGKIAIVGHHERDQLASVTDLVHGERLRRPWVRELGMGDEQRRGLVQRSELRRREHKMDAPPRACARGVDRPDARPRVQAPYARRVKQARRRHVGDEAAEPAQ